MKNPIWIIWLVLCLSACGSRTPDYVISEKDMEDLLVDIHKSEAVIESNYNIYNNNADKKKIREAVFLRDRKSTRLNSSHIEESRMPSSA